MGILNSDPIRCRAGSEEKPELLDGAWSQQTADCPLGAGNVTIGTGPQRQIRSDLISATHKAWVCLSPRSVRVCRPLEHKFFYLNNHTILHQASSPAHRRKCLTSSFSREWAATNLRLTPLTNHGLIIQVGPCRSGYGMSGSSASVDRSHHMLMSLPAREAVIDLRLA